MKKVRTAEEISQALCDPFPAKDLEWRLQTSGKTSDNKIWAMALVYVTNRAIQQRLDEVVGVDRWKNEYDSAPEAGIICGLSIKFGEEWITKWDGAEKTKIDPLKGGLSNSMKRAAVQWGIGRYLYNIEATFVNCQTGRKEGWIKASLKDKTKFYWQMFYTR